ncbi:MAG: UDP-3-O-(3-hydroxymyristoyl)glucosamine N-acyltransferase [Planctomycetaceae bacterium]|nr:UDP-3-O-(3-hydroxymyristoyl)glucosamine N-acyltransferase [Planctomycetaceae bacterium]
MSFTANELATKINAQVLGDGTLLLTDVASLDAARPSQLSYLESRKQLGAFKASQAGAVLVTEDLADDVVRGDCTAILVDQPQAKFIEAMLLLRPPREHGDVGVSPRAIVSETAQIGENCQIHAGAQVGDDVILGDRCVVGPGVIIGAGCQLGDDCHLYANAVLYPDMRIGNRVIIHANATIGCDGFGYRFVNGQLVKIPHTGTVILNDDVEVGAGSTIDRGMIEATVIGQGTKIDNQVQIAHNCRIGRGNAFAAQVGLAGSVTTGDYVQMGGQVGIADHCNIGSGIKFGGQAGTFGNVTDPGVYHGTPALPEKEAIKLHLTHVKLPELRNQVKKLTAQVAALEAQLAQSAPPSSQRSAA